MAHFDASYGDPVDGVVTFSWRSSGEPDMVEACVRNVSDDLLGRPDVRRIEIALPATDRIGRRAALRAGFRVEGTRRQVLRSGDGGYDDQVCYARLAEDVTAGPIGFSAVMNTALPRTRMIAHVLIRDAAGRVLFCQTRFKEDWELPGGIVEPREAPRLAAIREVEEELGVRRRIEDLLAVDWMPPYLGWDDAVELIFDGGLVTEDELAAFVLQPTEIASVRLCTLDEAASHLIPLSLRRLRTITALAPGETVLLEDGSPVR